MVLSLFLRWSLKKCFNCLDKKTTGAHTETESSDFYFKVFKKYLTYNTYSLVSTPNYVDLKYLSYIMVNIILQ
jgi:hypothetical protein